MPLFSLIIACYKQEHFIRETVESALSIPYPDKEIIVVDDASPDRTGAILDEYADRIRIIKNQENMGANFGRNAAAQVAKGRFIVFLDGDDLYLPWSLDLYARIIERKEPKIILCRMKFFEGATPKPQFQDFGTAVQVVEYDALIHKEYSYRGSAGAIVVDRDVFLSVGGFTRELFPVECDDLTFKLGYSGKTVQILSHPTILYRIHANNTVHQVSRFLDGFVTLVQKEKRGEYPGGSSRRYISYSFIGGPVYFWVMQGIRAHEYRRAAKLFAGGWLIILVAVWSRVLSRIKGRRQPESITI